MNRGIVWSEKGDLDKAGADFSRAVRIDPTNGGAYAGRADVWRAKGQFDKALDDLDHAIKLNPDLGSAYTTKGQVLEARGEIDQARAAYKLALTAPSHVGHRGRQGIYFELSERDKATAKARLEVLEGATPLAQPPASNPAAPAQNTPTEKKTEDTRIRVALVIGNGAYKGATPLPNPPNDARALAKTLRGMKFEVTEGIDLDRAGMEKAVHEFLLKVPKASIALLFYAGHGIQIAHKNYLVPVDADATSMQSLMAGMTALDTILASLDDRIRTNIVILDACRDNPLVKKEIAENVISRSMKIGSGLAAPGELGKGATIGAGTLIAFATAPGAVALDGAGANSPFSAALVRHISTPGLEVQQMLTACAPRWSPRPITSRCRGRIPHCSATFIW